jgi:hypothetical protein
MDEDAKCNEWNAMVAPCDTRGNKAPLMKISPEVGFENLDNKQAGPHTSTPSINEQGVSYSI